MKKKVLEPLVSQASSKKKRFTDPDKVLLVLILQFVHVTSIKHFISNIDQDHKEFLRL